MSKVSIYLNFSNQTEEAFLYYQSVFGTKITEPGFRRFGDMPPMEGMPPLPDNLKNGVMHVELAITGGFKIMGTDAPNEMGFNVKFGNNVYINLEPDTRAETKRLFDALSDGGKVEQELSDMFWGAYFGSCEDKYGVRWMFNCEEKA
ncbi:MAG: VOC family protein [Saprospiraceae bacterium]|nr:VOC family protein [Saprospiraceae bacterium]